MKIITILIFLFIPFSHPKDLTSTDLLHKMYNRYHGKWHSTLSFTQTTEMYRKDTLFKKQTWYEHILYPDLLRIDFDVPNSGNGIIFRHDSTYRFDKNKIVRAVKNENELIFFLGGLYFVPFEQALEHFKALHYDLSKFHEDTWKGKPAYVIGANTTEEKVNQLWIDKERLVAVRFIKYDDNTKEEGTFENQIPLKGAWSETLCKFYINDKILQTETYTNLVGGASIDKNIFEPSMMGK